MKNPIIQVKVTIDGIEPPIWRRLLIGSTTTFNELHHTLQIAFGWENSHLFQFEVEDYNIGVPNSEDVTETIDSSGVMVSKILKKVGDEISYEYDFGDSWYHTITVEKLLKIEPGVYYPSCLAGERSAPPENCGGVDGYNAIMKEDGKEYHQLHSSSIKSFHPEYFNLERVNNQLAHLGNYIKKIEKEEE